MGISKNKNKKAEEDVYSHAGRMRRDTTYFLFPFAIPPSAKTDQIRSGCYGHPEQGLNLPLAGPSWLVSAIAPSLNHRKPPLHDIVDISDFSDFDAVTQLNRRHIPVIVR
jgi:hypothetical protein